jgi:hypothetical protein
MEQQRADVFVSQALLDKFRASNSAVEILIGFPEIVEERCNAQIEQKFFLYLTATKSKEATPIASPSPL